ESARSSSPRSSIRCLLRRSSTEHLLMDRNFNGDSRPALGFAGNFKSTPHGMRALAHIQQAEMPARRIILRAETAPVVGDAEANLFFVVFEKRIHFVGAAVLDGVSHGFLPDTKQVHFDSCGQPD